MKTLLDSERREMEMRDHKKKKAFEDMQLALELKEEKRREDELLVRKEEAKYTAYVKELDSREEAVKKDRQ